MIAIELEAPIVNHRLDVTSLELPTHVTKARVIVLYEGQPEDKPSADIDGVLARSRGISGNHLMDEIDADLNVRQSASCEGPLAEFRANPIKVKTFAPLSREEANAR